jgi:protein Mpv17
VHSALLQRRPLLAQCATTAVLSGTGDVLAQQAVERKGASHDVRVLVLTPARVFAEEATGQFARTARQAFWGGALLAPVVYRWYGALQRLPIRNARAATVAKVALDQVVFAPGASFSDEGCGGR